MERSSAQGPWNEIWWKVLDIFLSNLCDFLRINVFKFFTCCDWQVFFFISEGFEDFSYPKAITDSPFKSLIIKFIPFLHKDFFKIWIVNTRSWQNQQLNKLKKISPHSVFCMFLTMVLCLVLPGFAMPPHIFYTTRIVFTTFSVSFKVHLSSKTHGLNTVHSFNCIIFKYTIFSLCLNSKVTLFRNCVTFIKNWTNDQKVVTSINRIHSNKRQGC